MNEEQKKFITLVVPASILSLVLLFIFLTTVRDTDERSGSNQIEESDTYPGDKNQTNGDGNIDEVADGSSSGQAITDGGLEESEAPLAVQTLTVSSTRCIGCGKCARIDPEHFEMSGRTAEVISTDNLSSANLERAADVCPAGAISLK